MPSVATSTVAEINNQWLVVHDNGRVFAPVSKNANTSIKRAIQNNTEREEFVPKDDVIRKWPDYEVVAVVRNPFDRLVSCYEFFQKVQPYYNRQYEFPTVSSFKEFLAEVRDWPDETANKHFRSQYNLLSQDGIFLPSVVIDFEDLVFIKDYFRILRLEHKKGSGRTSYRDYYKPEWVKWVESRFWKDLEFFNYSF